MTDALIIIAFLIGAFIILGWVLRILFAIALAIYDRKEKRQ